MICLALNEYLGVFVPWPHWASHDAEASLMKGSRGIAKSEAHPTSLNHQLLLKIRRLSFYNTSSVPTGRIAKIISRSASLLLRVSPLKRAALVLSISIQSDL